MGSDTSNKREEKAEPELCGAVASSVLPLGADGADLATSLLDLLPWDTEELPPQI